VWTTRVSTRGLECAECSRPAHRAAFTAGREQHRRRERVDRRRLDPGPRGGRRRRLAGDRGGGGGGVVDRAASRPTRRATERARRGRRCLGAGWRSRFTAGGAPTASSRRASVVDDGDLPSRPSSTRHAAGTRMDRRDVQSLSGGGGGGDSNAHTVSLLALRRDVWTD